jgi:Ca2+-binding EF-hand superfamily protein
MNFNLIIQSFNFFDADDDGEITKEDLTNILKTDNPDINNETVE